MSSGTNFNAAARVARAYVLRHRPQFARGQIPAGKRGQCLSELGQTATAISLSTGLGIPPRMARESPICQKMSWRAGGVKPPVLYQRRIVLLSRTGTFTGTTGGS